MKDNVQKTINERILELVEDMDGPSEVARLMGINPQLFYNLKNRPSSKPNSESLERFFEVAPRANANYIYKGIGPKWLNEPEVGDNNKPILLLGSGNSTPDPTPPAGTMPLPTDQLDWKDRFEALEKKYDALLEQYNSVVNFLTKNAKLSFSKSSSLVTAPEMSWSFNVDGFVQAPKALGCKVVSLNSLDVVRPMYAVAITA